MVPHGLAALPIPWALCLIGGLGVTALALVGRFPPALRAFFFCLGQVVFWTAPLAGHLEPDLYGAFPTIDKSGSIAFYLDGVHRRLVAHPIASLSDPAVQLIGIHVGHLWLVEVFDTFLSTAGAFNAQALLYPTLGWWSAALLCTILGSSWSTGIALGFGFGMGLHVFADLNWYTVEKAAVFVLALYAASLAKTFQGGRWWVLSVVAWLGCALMNWYFALVAAVGAAVLLVCTRSVHLARACAATTLLALPLAWFQFQLLGGAAHPGSPEAYLYGRAALDVVSLADGTWNRLELWRALDPIFVAVAAWGTWKTRQEATTRVLLAAGSVFLLLSLGPFPLGLSNPLWLGLRAVVPGFWRVAEPEVFFQGTLLCALAIGARALGPHPRAWMYPVVAAIWVVSVETHPAFPGFSVFREPRLAPAWTHRETPGKVHDKVPDAHSFQDQTP
jgi:hypothetical protein